MKVRHIIGLSFNLLLLQSRRMNRRKDKLMHAYERQEEVTRRNTCRSSPIELTVVVIEYALLSNIHPMEKSPTLNIDNV